MNPTLAELTSIIRAARSNAPAADLPPSLAAPLQFGGVRVVTSDHMQAGMVPVPLGGHAFVISTVDYLAARDS